MEGKGLLIRSRCFLIVNDILLILKHKSARCKELICNNIIKNPFPGYEIVPYEIKLQCFGCAAKGLRLLVHSLKSANASDAFVERYHANHPAGLKITVKEKGSQALGKKHLIIVPFRLTLSSTCVDCALSNLQLSFSSGLKKTYKLLQ